jgi:hypothetical protein
MRLAFLAQASRFRELFDIYHYAPRGRSIERKCRLMKARPEPDFRYFSKAIAVPSSANAK